MIGTVREAGGGWVAITVDPDTDDYPTVGERVVVMSVGPDTLLPCTPTLDLLEPRSPTVGERWRAWRERCRQDRERRDLAWHRIRGVPTGSPPPPRETVSAPPEPPPPPDRFGPGHPAVPDPEVQPTLTVEQAGAILGLARSTAYAAARDGSIPTIRIGRRVIVPTAALRRMVGQS